MLLVRRPHDRRRCRSPLPGRPRQRRAPRSTRILAPLLRPCSRPGRRAALNTIGAPPRFVSTANAAVTIARAGIGQRRQTARPRPATTRRESARLVVGQRDTGEPCPEEDAQSDCDVDSEPLSLADLIEPRWSRGCPSHARRRHNSTAATAEPAHIDPEDDIVVHLETQRTVRSRRGHLSAGSGPGRTGRATSPVDRW